MYSHVSNVHVDNEHVVMWIDMHFFWTILVLKCFKYFSIFGYIFCNLNTICQKNFASRVASRLGLQNFFDKLYSKYKKCSQKLKNIWNILKLILFRKKWILSASTFPPCILSTCPLPTCLLLSSCTFPTCILSTCPLSQLVVCRYFGKIHCTRLLGCYTLGVNSWISTLHA